MTKKIRRQTGRKHLQKTYLPEDYYTKYTKNSKRTLKTQKKKMNPFFLKSGKYLNKHFIKEYIQIASI